MGRRGKGLGIAAPLGIERMREVAHKHGGKCLSKEYVNNKTPLLGECAEGHRWNARPLNVIHDGTWCPICTRRGLTRRWIERMREVAKERGGKCLSPEYVNNKTALLWQCADGYCWKAVPQDIKRGTWCPVCARSRRKAKSRTGRMARKTSQLGGE